MGLVRPYEPDRTRNRSCAGRDRPNNAARTVNACKNLPANMGLDRRARGTRSAFGSNRAFVVHSRRVCGDGFGVVPPQGRLGPKLYALGRNACPGPQVGVRPKALVRCRSTAPKANTASLPVFYPGKRPARSFGRIEWKGEPSTLDKNIREQRP